MGKPEKTEERAGGTPLASMGLMEVVVVCLLVSCLSSAAAVYAYDRWYAQKVVAVDIRGFMDELREKFSTGQIKEADIKSNMEKMERLLTSIPDNRAVIMGEIVLKNVPVLKPQ